MDDTKPAEATNRYANRLRILFALVLTVGGIMNGPRFTSRLPSPVRIRQYVKTWLGCKIYLICVTNAL